MITTVSTKQARDELHIHCNDPFQLATPCWTKSTWSQLPPETVRTINNKEITMPITKIQASAAPAKTARAFGSGNPVTEVTEVLEAIKTMKPDQAIKVELSPETAKRLAEKKSGKKQVPAKAFIILLRRKFKTLGVNFTAYTNDNKEIFVLKGK